MCIRDSPTSSSTAADGATTRPARCASSPPRPSGSCWRLSSTGPTTPSCRFWDASVHMDPFLHPSGILQHIPSGTSPDQKSPKYRRHRGRQLLHSGKNRAGNGRDRVGRIAAAFCVECRNSPFFCHSASFGGFRRWRKSR